MKNTLSNLRKGFTIIELMVAVGITVFLMSFVMVLWKDNMNIFFSKDATRETQKDMRGLFLSISTDVDQAFKIIKPAPGDSAGVNEISIQTFKDVSSGGADNTTAISSLVDDITYAFDSTAMTVTRTGPDGGDTVFDNIKDFTIYPMNDLSGANAGWTEDKADGAKYTKLNTAPAAKVKIAGGDETSCGMLVSLTGIAQWGDEPDDQEEISISFLSSSVFLTQLYYWRIFSHSVFNSLDSFPDF